jgi:hypothetical protein
MPYLLENGYRQVIGEYQYCWKESGEGAGEMNDSNITIVEW